MIRPLVIFYAFYWTFNPKFTKQTIELQAWVKSVNFLFFFSSSYLFVYVPLERWHKASRCNLQNLFPTQGTCHSESHSARFVSPPCIPCRAQKAQKGFSGRSLPPTVPAACTLDENNYGHLVPTPERSQISAVHFSSPLLNAAASSQPGDTPGMKSSETTHADQLFVSA